MYVSVVRVVRALSSESDLVTHSASPRAQTALALSATAACDDNATNSPSSSLHPHRSPHPSSLSSSLVSPLSLFADCKSLLASNYADVTSAPWCTPQVCATIAPVSCVSCTSCLTPRSSSLARGHIFSWTFSCFRVYSLGSRMFSPFFLYLRPVAPFFSLHIISFAIRL